MNNNEKAYKYYDLILGAYVCVVLCANLIGPAKISTVQVPWIGPVSFLAGVLFFPISYLFGDILTEVYGYARDRRVVWSGFGALVFAAFMAAVIVHLPPRDKTSAVEAIFGNTPRIIAASIIAFWCGELIDSALFYTIAFAGLWSTDKLLPIMLTQYVLKSAWEILATPLTYLIVGFLKRAEHEDYFDRHTRFTPFSLQT